MCLLFFQKIYIYIRQKHQKFLKNRQTRPQNFFSCKKSIERGITYFFNLKRHPIEKKKLYSFEKSGLIYSVPRNVHHPLDCFFWSWKRKELLKGTYIKYCTEKILVFLQCPYKKKYKLLLSSFFLLLLFLVSQKIST